MSFKITWEDVKEEADFSPIEEKFLLEEIPQKNISFSNEKPENIMIEGDNYPVLKLMQKKFEEKIDFIYIDPPYNTGKKSLCYNDSIFLENNSLYKTEDRHSAWLSFMERRLLCARKLLKDDGVIFISIGREELYTLKLLCDLIFGEENFVNDFMWLHGKGKKDKFSRTMQESNLCYAKNIKKLKPFIDFETSVWAKTNADNDSRGNWFNGSISFSEKRSNKTHENFYELTSPGKKKWKRQWFISKQEMQKLIDDNRIYWGKEPDFSNVPRKKIFNGEKTPVIPKNILNKIETTRSAQNHLNSLLKCKNAFTNPKPVDLIQHFIKIANLKNDITVLDFFAGSGTTLEAVSKLNQKDGGKRKCILIQKAEKLSDKETKFSSISELCYTRIKIVLSKTEENLKFFRLKRKN
ncbi:MAG: site-specific DNA-methyltransferase [Spirochaetia bacterium]|nr:site-specific DNA-methyltransferase [Spirochaetia bacterium]